MTGKKQNIDIAKCGGYDHKSVIEVFEQLDVPLKDIASEYKLTVIQINNQ